MVLMVQEVQMIVDMVRWFGWLTGSVASNLGQVEEHLRFEAAGAIAAQRCCLADVCKYSLILK